MRQNAQRGHSFLKIEEKEVSHNTQQERNKCRSRIGEEGRTIHSDTKGVPHKTQQANNTSGGRVLQYAARARATYATETEGAAQYAARQGGM